jgi:hypothetical protein
MSAGLRLRATVTVAAALVVGGCSGAATAPAPSRILPGTTSLLRAPLGSDAAPARQLTQISSTMARCGCIYVVQGSTNEILVFKRRGHPANRSPVQDIVGPDTGINGPSDIALDSAGRIYVTNVGSNVINIYAPNATGDAPPIATLGGAKTRIAGPTGIAFNRYDKIYVTDRSPSGPSTVLEFAPGATGDVPPVATIAGSQTRLQDTNSVAVDAKGEIFTSNFQSPSGSNEGYIEVFAPHAHGDALPIRSIQGSNTGMIGNYGIAVDAEGDTYVPVAGYNRLLVFSAGANGDVKPAQNIGGRKTLLWLPTDVALDRKHTIFVINQAQGGGSGIMGVTVFAADATGNVRPTRKITGNNTKFDWPGAIAVN